MRPPKLSLSSVYEDLRNDFRAGKDTRFTSRLTGVSSSGSGADYHYRSETQWLHMLERARHYQRNDPIMGQAIRRLTANVVQDGFTLDVDTGDTGLDQELKARFNSWAEDPDQCHSEGEFNWYQIEQLALSTAITDGDLFTLPLRSGELQLVEAHRCRTPRNTRKNVVHGVLLDSRSRRTEYWITKEDIDPNRALSKVSDIVQYPSRDGNTGERLVNHLYMPSRFSQRRGISAIAPISDTVGMHDDIQFATLVKLQMSSLIALFHERGADWQPLGDQQKGDRSTEVDGGYTRTIEGVSAGLEIFGDRDEKLSAFSPQIPSPQFHPHAMLILTFIAVNLDLPVAVLLLDPSNTNFSGWRGAIDQARMRFKQIQQWLANSLHRRTYRWKVRQFSEMDPVIATVGSKNGVDLFGHRWGCPTFAYIEPLKDAQSDLLQLENNLTSPRRLQQARGRDFEEVLAETIEDNSLTIEMAMSAAKDLGGDITWRDILNPRSNQSVSQSEEDTTPPALPQQRQSFNGNGSV